MTANLLFHRLTEAGIVIYAPPPSQISAAISFGNLPKALKIVYTS